MVDGPDGTKITVVEACELAGEGPQGDRVYYNDIQCGNGPANSAGDEDWCPGRVDLGPNNKDGCMVIGPKWPFATEAPAPAPSPAQDSAPVPDDGNVNESIVTGADTF